MKSVFRWMTAYQSPLWLAPVDILISVGGRILSPSTLLPRHWNGSMTMYGLLTSNVFRLALLSPALERAMKLLFVLCGRSIIPQLVATRLLKRLFYPVFLA